MIAPAMRPSIVRRNIRNWPMALAEAPSATKTSEKPRMKASDEVRTRLRTGEATATPPVPRISSSERPEMYER